MSTEIYYVKSPTTGNVYQVDATKRTNMTAQGYVDVTAEHRSRAAAQPTARRSPAAAPIGTPPAATPASGESTQTAGEGKTA